MRKIILASVCCFCASALSAAEKPDFSTLDFSSQINTVSAQAPTVKVPVSAPAPAPAKTGHYMQVSAYVSLTGNGFLPGTTGGFTSVTLSGWATFRDSTGEVTSNNTYINVPASMWIYPNQYVFQTVYPNIYAQFSYKGQPAGSASMTGSVSVSGWPSGNFVTLNGSGTLNGSVYVEDAK
jgi:hypothetical protein